MKKGHKGGIILDQYDIQILYYLLGRKKRTITEIRKLLEITHANLTPHLKRLEEYKLIERERDKQTIFLKTTRMFENLYKIDFIKEVFKKCEFRKVR